MAQKVIVAYVPVLHYGYKRLFDEFPDCKELLVLTEEVTGTYRHLQKEIRALKPELALQAIKGWSRFDRIELAGVEALQVLAGRDVEIILPDDEVSHDLQEAYFKNNLVTFSPVFLRWDRRASNTPKEVDALVISEDEMASKMLQLAYKEARRSTNIWRHVGAVLAKDGEIISYAYNRPRPTDYSSWIDGDVRANFGKGVGIEMSTDQHAESCAIADAARQGISLEGADIYTTTFPCPPCAMLIAYSGVARLYYAEGYAVLDGQRILDDQGVQVYKVAAAHPKEDERSYVPYPEA